MTDKSHVALTKCYFCNEDNEILLARTYTQRGEPVHDLAPYQGKVVNMHPCPKCEGYMKQGVILLTIDDAKSEPDWHKPPPTHHCYVSSRECFGGSKCECNCAGCHAAWMPNPYRTGGFFVLTDDAIRRMITEASLADWAIKYRFMFIEHEAAERLGLFAAHADKEDT